GAWARPGGRSPTSGPAAPRALPPSPTRRSSDLAMFSTHYRQQLNLSGDQLEASLQATRRLAEFVARLEGAAGGAAELAEAAVRIGRKSTRLNSSHVKISYAVFCLKKKSARQRGE